MAGRDKKTHLDTINSIFCSCPMIVVSSVVQSFRSAQARPVEVCQDPVRNGIPLVRQQRKLCRSKLEELFYQRTDPKTLDTGSIIDRPGKWTPAGQHTIELQST